MKLTVFIITYAIMIILSIYLFAKADDKNRDGLYILMGLCWPIIWVLAFIFGIVVLAKKHRNSKDAVKE